LGWLNDANQCSADSAIHKSLNWGFLVSVETAL
jgi:hypothetical protein